MAKALVGHVQKGDQIAGLDGGNHLLPLSCGDVVAGGVVAAGVQYHDGAGRRRLNAGQHAFKIDAALGRIVVRVGLHFKAGAGEQGAVVFPARVADHHLGVRVQAFEEVGADLQAARAANGLDRGHAAGLDGFAVGPENQALDCGVIGGNAVDGQITAGRRGFCHGFFSCAHALQQGQLAAVVVINTHAEVDLVGVGVGVELLVQTQDRVAGGHFDSGEH